MMVTLRLLLCFRLDVQDKFFAKTMYHNEQRKKSRIHRV